MTGQERKFCEEPPGVPCMQGPAIHRMDEKLDKVIDALQTLAVQDTKIDQLYKTNSDHREWLKGHEVRIQVLEKLPGKTAGSVLVMLGGCALTVIAGLIVYIATHWKG